VILTEFLLARIAEDEVVAMALLRDLEGQIEAEGFAADERGPFTPARMLAAQLWAHYDGQTRWRNFARGQHIATLAAPARALAECEAKRQIVDQWLCRYDDNPRHVDQETLDARDTLCALALPYADHPDCRKEWKP